MSPYGGSEKRPLYSRQFNVIKIDLNTLRIWSAHEPPPDLCRMTPPKSAKPGKISLTNRSDRAVGSTRRLGLVSSSLSPPTKTPPPSPPGNSYLKKLWKSPYLGLRPKKDLYGLLIPTPPIPNPLVLKFPDDPRLSIKMPRKCRFHPLP